VPLAAFVSAITYFFRRDDTMLSPFGFILQVNEQPRNTDQLIMASSNSDRQKAIDIAIGQIEKQHGKGTIMRLGDDAYNGRWTSFRPARLW
jgi:hypothetical protein